MVKPRIIAFYLPQYHPIPENDEWWGEGFTDWVNVVKAKPRFYGHYQPHIPTDLGFYDLRKEETRLAQAEMAREYGIFGFCYYHYWFNERMLLERPFNEVLNSGKPDFPFCLCWANENWTRRWDGHDNEILMGQNYEDYNPEIHLLWLEKAFADKRYIRIDEKPLLLIYNTIDIPDLKNKITIWRKTARKKGYRDLYLCAVKSVHYNLSDSEVINFGFDAIVDFIPNNEILKYRKTSGLSRYYFNRIINKIISVFRLENKFKKLPITEILSYKKIVNYKIKQSHRNFKYFPCVFPSWDNSARKKSSHVIQNEDFEIYKKWLENSIEKIKYNSSDEQIVFINAWNEWAEGCHLEPDIRNGRKFLNATLEIVKMYFNDVVNSN
jgi:lipopolysaccharide biosynthesis protein